MKSKRLKEKVKRCLLFCAGARWKALEGYLADDGISPGLTYRSSVNVLFSSMVSCLKTPSHDSDATCDADLPGPALLQSALIIARLQMAKCYLLSDRKEKAQAQVHQYLRSLVTLPPLIGVAFNEEEVSEMLVAGRGLLRRLESQLEIGRAIRSGELSDQLIFVVGMHRSGTSALAGMLCQMGLDPPVDLMHPTDDNPRGYWESWELHLLNDRFLKRIGHGWNFQVPLPVAWEDSEPALLWRSELLSHLKKTFKGKDLPLIKDPRLGILLSGLDPWLQAYALSAKFLILVRHPLEVAASLQKSQEISIEGGIRLWLLYMFSLENDTRGFPRMVVKFETLMHKPAKLGRKVKRFLGVRAFADKGGYAICDEAIHRDLRHHYANDMDQLLREAKMHSPVDTSMAIALYELLCKNSSARLEAVQAKIDGLKQIWGKSY